MDNGPAGSRIRVATTLRTPLRAAHRPLRRVVTLALVGVAMLSAVDDADGCRLDRPRGKGGVAWSTGGHYIDSRGHSVHSPVAADRAPEGASARCRDGTFSFSHSRRGTCSRHGGVAQWL